MVAAGENDATILEDSIWREKASTDLGLVTLGNFPQSEPPSVQMARDMQRRAPVGLKLLPSLILRHAAGRLFQEAHAVIESEQLGLFGQSALITSPGYSPSGAYFTPVRIARVLTEWALKHKAKSQGFLRIADFACGSAVFLTEALRTLERIDFHGKVDLIGRDSSAQAITMARVAIRNVERDLQHIEVNVDLRQESAFESEWPKADVILMNPPFRSWEKMNPQEREWVNQVTGGANRGRPDLSVGFAERAMQSLTESGVLATMIPAGVLASDGLSKWRNSLAHRANPTLIAVLGEHGLFQHALVNVGMIALEKITSVPSEIHPPDQLHVAWSSAEAGSASKAIRALRRTMSEEATAGSGDESGGWSVTTTSLTAWNRRHSWLPGAGALGPLLERIQLTTPTKVGDIFTVHQGIRTGANQAFLISGQQLETIPQDEHVYFKAAVESDSFVNGEIQRPVYLFVPDPRWEHEEDVEKRIPYFFNHHLRPRRSALLGRKSLLDDRWWTLTRGRDDWAYDGRPRLLSKRFGLFPSFARDLRGSLAPVQANAWVPKNLLASRTKAEVGSESLTSYWWLLNSRIMVAVMREYCPNVAGGQLDLEHKYVKNVPLPELIGRFETNPSLQAEANSIRSRYGETLPPTPELDHFAATAFATDVSDWNLSGLGVPTQWK